MIGNLCEDCAVIDTCKEIERQGFGVKRGEKIYLHPIEALYLQLNGKAKFAEFEKLVNWVQAKVPNFPEVYFVYSDLRAKGYKAKPQDEFIVARRKFYPISEKKEVDFEILLEKLEKEKSFIVAIVDEESEVTYYELFEAEIKGEQVESLPKIRGKILNDRVIVENADLFKKYFYGNLIGNSVILSIFESLYLCEIGALEIDLNKLRGVAEKIKDFDKKYEVYKDLKRRGFVVKTGFKFGCDFRIYRKVESIEDLPHSEFLVLIAKKALRLLELARAIRVANAVRKKLLVALRGRYILFDRVKV
ncbi:MAG: tRNA-intron lyase [Archaeoglobaceae archaeon]